MEHDGRTIIIDLCENGQTVSIAAIYAPNDDKPEYFQHISELLRVRGENKIVVGDFNLTLSVEIDRLNTYHNNSRAKIQVENMMEEFALKDVWRIQNESSREYSWRKKGDIQKASRIDFALVSGGIDQYVKTSQYLPGIKSDHRALYFILDLQLFERGSGYWKFNTSLLQQTEYIQLMNKEINTCMQASEGKSPTQLWEILKTRIKKTTQQYSRNKVSEDKLIISQLSEVISDYESRLPLIKEEYEMLENSQKELEEKTMEKAKGIIFRSKAKWYEEGEKNTKYFFALEKAKYNAKTCYKILDENKGEVTNPMEILEVQREFYQDLYQQDEHVKFTLANTTDVKVPPDIQMQQDQPIDASEVEKAIKQMKNNKTPGQDGIPIDFYKVFWNHLKQPFLRMIEEVYEQRQLHVSARKGILNLIPKPNKDSRIIKNLRPITLLNTDYKIIEKVIANKMIPALEQIISKDQRGFMKERRISVNIRKLLDIMHYVEREDIEALVLSLDFVKCFDKCSFSILHGSLEYFGFGEVVKIWTKILYKDYSVRIQNNGHFSESIDILKGVHQGGCCSSIYFLVIAEILALNLRNNGNIQSIEIQQIMNILNQFADDMDIFTLAKEDSLQSIFWELDSFQKQSGFTVSYDKTTLYRIGSLRHSDAKLFNMDQYAWSNKEITVLGITIAHEDILKKNYDPIMVKVDQILQTWCNRGLSLIGRVQVINSLIASQFVYKMMVLPKMPSVYIKKLESKFREYLWDGKKNKIALRTLQLPKKDGGLGLVDMKRKECALKATWPQILATEQEYAQIVYQSMRCSILKEDIWRCTILPEHIDLLRIKNIFWSDTWKCWSEYNFMYKRRIENQLIWYNSYIIIGNKPVLWKDNYVKGLRYVYQLFENKQYKSEYQVWEEFGLTKLRFNSLKKAIPKEWKTFFTTNMVQQFFPMPPHNFDMCQRQYKLASSIYEYLADDCTQLYGKYSKWTMELGTPLCEDIFTFGRLHQQIYKVTNIVKYRSFQYRLLQRGIVTNIQLYKWNIKPTDLCYFCQEHRETITHLMSECKIVKELWDDVSQYCISRFGAVEINLQSQNVIKNTIVPHGKHVINFICLITKQFIYRQRCLQLPIHFVILKREINKIENIEKYIAVKNGKLATHQRKWGTIIQNVQCANIEQYVQNYVNSMVDSC